MSQVLRDYIQEVEKARKGLNRVKGQLQSQKRRDKLRSLVEKYFREVRSSLVSKQEQDEATKLVDDWMQELLVLCHKRSMARLYQEILTNAKTSLIALDSQAITFGTKGSAKKDLDIVDTLILQTLQSVAPSAALSYEQAAIDMQTDNRLSWRGPATDLREALRETLDL